MFKKLFFVLMIVILAACGEDSSDSDSGIQAANQDQRSTDTNISPTPEPVTPAPDQGTSGIQLESPPDDLTGQLVMTWGARLYVVPFDGTPVESLLENVSVLSVHGNQIVTGLDSQPQTVSVFDITSGELTKLADLEADQSARVDKWSPDGQWFTAHVETGGEWINVGSGRIFTAEQVDYLLFGIDGQQIELPITPPDATTRVGGGWLTDNTLLIADGVERRRVARLLRVDPNNGDVTELDISNVSVRSISFLTGFFDNFIRDQMNSELEPFGLELVPVEGDLGIGGVAAPDNSYAVDIELQGDGNAGACVTYWVTQEPREVSFTTRLLHTGEAQDVSRAILTDERIHFFQTASPSCQEDDLQIDLMRIENFENPVVETLYTAKPALEIASETLYSYLVHDDYLLWTTVNGSNIEILATDLTSSETTILLSVPHGEGQELPNLHAVIGDL